VDKKTAAKKILNALKKDFPNPSGALVFTNPLELLIATILSAQATDKLVNTVTPGLFKKYKTAASYANASVEEIETAISRVNFFRNKARSIKNCCVMIADEFKGKVPKTLDELVRLPGVGRKTANIVLGNAFGIDSLAVDTHVKRVTNRLGLSKASDPDRIEAELCALIDKGCRTEATHLFILHGRSTCKARGPLCSQCRINAWCEFYKTGKKAKG